MSGLGLQEDIKLGKKIATGGFGTVYRGELIDDRTGESSSVIVKKVVNALPYARPCAICNECNVFIFPTQHLQEWNRSLPMAELQTHGYVQ